jgi:hypothetical protein
VGLARHGDARAVEGLVEMLDPENDAAVASETSPGEREWKRSLIMMNAIRAAGELEEKNPAADQEAIDNAIARILDPKSDNAVNLEVREAARELIEARPAH